VANGRFGSAVAGSNFFSQGHIGGPSSTRDGRPDVLVGQPGITQSALANAGRVILYFSNFTSAPTTWPTAPYLTLLGDSVTRGNLGISLDGLADYDGDGMLDFAAGEPIWGAHGRVRLYSGRKLVSGADGGILRNLAANDSNIVPVSLCPAQISIRFGWSVKNLANFQQNGLDQVAVGAPRSMEPLNCSNYSGSFFILDPNAGTNVFTSTASGLNMIHQGNTSNNDVGFGQSMAAGDFDRDGRVDLYASRPMAQWNFRMGGLWALSGRLLGALWAWNAQIFRSDQSDTDSWNGTSIVGLGDTNSDGMDEILMGSPGVTVNSQTRAGRAGIIRSVPTSASAPGFSYTLDMAGSAQLNAMFGSVLANVGDVNGDEANDIAAGEPDFDGAGFTSNGRVTVYNSKTGARIATLTGAVDQERFGASIAGVGDLNNDGVADVAIGAPRAISDGGSTRAGRVYVYSGASLSSTPVILFTLSGQVGDEQFGYSIAALGDFARDGRPALAVGAPYTINGMHCNPGWQVGSGLATMCSLGTLGAQPGRVYIFRMPCRIDDPAACQSP
jgi:hypothetical protein